MLRTVGPPGRDPSRRDAFGRRPDAPGLGRRSGPCAEQRPSPLATRRSRVAHVAQELERATPRVGRVVGAVSRTVGIVHEAVLGSGIHDDLVIREAGPRRSQRVHVCCGCERVGVAEDRECGTCLRRGVEGLGQARTAPLVRQSDHPVERDPRDRNVPSQRPSTCTCRPCRIPRRRQTTRRRQRPGGRLQPPGRRAGARRRARESMPYGPAGRARHARRPAPGRTARARRRRNHGSRAGGTGRRTADALP